MARKRNLPSTNAYLMLRRQAQEAFDFTVVVCHAIPALKLQVTLLERGVVKMLPTPDYFAPGRTGPAQLRAQATNYKQVLARFTLISSFSAFEAFVDAAVREFIAFHGGEHSLVERARRHDRHMTDGLSDELEKHKQRLRGPRDRAKLQRYAKHGRALGVCPGNDLGPVFGGSQTIDSIEIVDPEPNARSRFESPSRQTHYWDRLLATASYRFASERFSAYGIRALLRDLGALRAADIPNVLRQAFQMDVSDTTVSSFHAIRELRNRIAHGGAVNLSLREVAGYNEVLRRLAQQIDEHLNEHYLMHEEVSGLSP